MNEKDKVVRKYVKMNYQIELEKVLKTKDNIGKRLFLHSCCAPCSSYVLEYLRKYFRITVFYYNPNISEEEEYQKRVKEQIRFIHEMNAQKDGFLIEFIEGDYEPELYFKCIKGYEQCKEGGERCNICFDLRLSTTAEEARKRDFDFFATTLTISPLKNAERINEIGFAMQDKYSISYLPSDFKKKNGYKRSIELSKEYDLYRQNFCGCVFSKIQAQDKEMHEWRK